MYLLSTKLIYCFISCVIIIMYKFNFVETYMHNFMLMHRLSPEDKKFEVRRNFEAHRKKFLTLLCKLVLVMRRIP